MEFIDAFLVSHMAISPIDIEDLEIHGYFHFVVWKEASKHLRFAKRLHC
jgi:hypothetical protein